MNMTADQMRLAAKILGGESIESNSVSVSEADADFERLTYVSDSEDDSFTGIEEDRQNRLQKARELIYNDSDDEDERQSISKSKNATKESNMFDLIKNGAEENEEEPETDQNNAHAMDSEEYNSQVIRRRLAELDDSDSDNEIGILNSVTIFFFRKTTKSYYVNDVIVIRSKCRR